MSYEKIVEEDAFLVVMSVRSLQYIVLYLGTYYRFKIKLLRSFKSYQQVFCFFSLQFSIRKHTHAFRIFQKEADSQVIHLHATQNLTYLLIYLTFSPSFFERPIPKNKIACSTNYFLGWFDSSSNMPAPEANSIQSTTVFRLIKY